MSYFILIKGKKAKNWGGAIPASAKATRSQLESLIKRSLKARYSAKIITAQQFTSLMKKGSVRLLERRKKYAKSPSKRKK